MQEERDHNPNLEKTFRRTNGSNAFENIRLPTPHKHKKVFESTSTYVALSKKRIPWLGWMKDHEYSEPGAEREVFNIEHMTINHKSRINGFCKIHGHLYLINGVVTSTDSPVKVNFECLNVDNMVRVMIFSGMIENHVMFGKYRVCDIEEEDLIKMNITMPELTKGIFEVELKSSTFEGYQVALSEEEFTKA